MPPDPHEALAALGLPASGAVPIAGPASRATVYRFESPDGPRVLRLLDDGGRVGCESALHALLRDQGVPALEVLAAGPVPGGGAMVLPFLDADNLLDELRSDPGELFAWGERCGRLFARIHQIPATAAPVGCLPSWLDWYPLREDTAAALAPWLDHPVFAPQAVLHLDFNTLNMLVGAGRIRAVLDWTNARSGPPIADLARTRARLYTLGLVFAETTLTPGHIARYQAGLRAGHAWECGPVPEEALAAADAWAFDTLITDLTARPGGPPVWLTEDRLSTLERRRDLAVGTTLPPAA